MPKPLAMPGPVRKFMTAADKNLLISLFEEKREILSRSKGSHRNKWKKAAWDAIAAQFNSTEGISAPRTPEQLAKAWENLLAKAKKECVTVRQAINRCNTQSDNVPKVLHVSSLSNCESHDTPVNEYGTVTSESSATCYTIHPVYNTIDYEDQYLEDVTSESRSQTVIKEETADHNSDSELFSEGTQRLSTGSTAAPTPTSSNTDDVMAMRRERHEAKMTKLYWETLYWRTKYEREFGNFTQSDNNALNAASDSTGHGSSDDREN